MIVYQSTKKGFINDVLNGSVENCVNSMFVREVGHSTSRAELLAWRNSLPYMSNVINHADIPDDAGIAIEYKIPQTAKRIDFIISGFDDNNKRTAILVELKQWSGAEITELDGVVSTFVGGSNRQVSHPSYQAWSYSVLLEDFNSNVQDEGLKFIPCAYLHNYEVDNVINNDFYKRYIDLAPLFLKPDALKLQDFIKKHVRRGDKGEILYIVENGKIRPSKALADSLSSMLKGNVEFVLIDDQKIIFETVLNITKEQHVGIKNVLVVEGGPGTGKSVVAINLLVELTKRGKVAQYVTKNAAPRVVYQSRLSGQMTKSRIASLFTSSGSFVDTDKDTFDVLLVDEAHRLNEKSGMFSNKGENQIKELISAAKNTVFFIDEDQRVTTKDIGTKEEITFWAKRAGANIINAKLSSQFRCNGSDGYLAWLDNTLQINDTANETMEGIGFDFKVVESPERLHEQIINLNTRNKSRLVAGYCWEWISKKDKDLFDIQINNYKARWNLNSQGQSWIIQPNSVSEIGCIHTCQGLDLEYVGVIIGSDLVVRNGIVITDATKRASSDQSLKGIKSLLKKGSDDAKRQADLIIKNTYRTLMTRGMKGCYVYCVDKETQDYFRNRINNGQSNKTKYSNIEDGATLNS